MRLSELCELHNGCMPEMLDDPYCIMGLGDGGAHVGFILDAGYSNLVNQLLEPNNRNVILLKKLVRGSLLTAKAVGLFDRGRIAVGLKADFNVIDWSSEAEILT